MSKSIMLLAMAGLVAAVSACSRPAPQQEFVVVDPEPISIEPVYTGKYK
ncbi:hypothetical protein VK792_03615 [Mesobacterium sp. TK19101]|uniref:Lipoprotein n=1 Tax=Mesobacterium hydrothermale TaxID=3111907 RepID=A0ABU6HGY0_9RHOB|nr:hypothetical protein [Mesobacterium sp. TK19101]MEC3860360.1 hypothetical protein [Mesobacterium sp. TK19101]